MREQNSIRRIAALARAAPDLGPFRMEAPMPSGRANREIYGAWKPKGAIPFLERPVQKFGRFLPSNAGLSFIVRPASQCKLRPRESRRNKILVALFGFHSRAVSRMLPPSNRLGYEIRKVRQGFYF